MGSTNGMADIDVKLLCSFLSVAAEGSFSRAAERVGCSQPTISLRIQTLERILGFLWSTLGQRAQTE